MSLSSTATVSLELTDTALKLSKVIEREAKRRSALHNSNMARVQANIPSLRHSSSTKIAPGATKSMRSSRSQRGSVAPTPEDEPVVSADPKVSTISAPSNPPPLERDESRRRSEFASESMNESEEPGGCRQTIWLLIDDPNSSIWAYYLSVTVFGFIVISTITFIADTEPALDSFEDEIGYIETLCAAVFTLELVVRIVFCPNKFVFFRTLGNWIDIAAILPYYLEKILAVKNASSLSAVRIVRLTRVARVLKMSRYSSAIQVFVQAISISVKPLSMLIFLMSIAMTIFSSAIYFAELTPDGCRSGGWIGNCDPKIDEETGGVIGGVVASSPAAAAASAVTFLDECICVDPNPYRSITAAFWWCIVTMSTVGYGDMTPVTVMGKIIGALTVLTGMLVLALPITVIGANFQKVMKSVMHETMKTNVDYLKGKRMLCREEIEAILERFHAVTENIHLDIDDVINVYDTDNSGMLEDEELARFRQDLEVLQNRAMISQMGVEDVGLAARATAASISNSRAARGSAHSIKQVATLKSIIRQMTNDPNAPSESQDCTQNPGPVFYSTARTTSSVANGPFLDPVMARMSSKRSIEQDLSVSSRSGSARQLQIDEEQLLLRLLDMQQSIEERVAASEQRLETKINNMTKILMRLERMIEMDD